MISSQIIAQSHSSVLWLLLGVAGNGQVYDSSAVDVQGSSRGVRLRIQTHPGSGKVSWLVS